MTKVRRSSSGSPLFRVTVPDKVQYNFVESIGKTDGIVYIY
jgi:hypothetical protein